MRPTDPRLRRQLAPARWPIAGVLTAGVVASVLVVAQAWTVAGLVVAVAERGTPAPWALAVLVVFGLRALVGGTSDVLAALAAAAVGTALRLRVVEAVLRRAADPGASCEPQATGGTAVLATRGAAAAEPYLTRYLPAVALATILPPLIVVAIATQDLLSAVIVLATLPLVPVFGILLGMATRDRAEVQWRALSSLSGHFVDVVRGLPTLVVHRRARAQSRTIREVTDRYRRASLSTLRLAFASSAVLELVATLSVALVAVVVGVRLAAGHLHLHTALVVLLLAPEAYWPLRRVGAEFHASAEGIATFEAVEALTDRASATSPGPDAAGPQGAALEVRGLTVRHRGRTAPALHDLDLTVPARGVTVVTGPSGCGKSTLLAALAGLAHHEAGTIRVGGHDVGGEAWRSRIAWLPQRPVFVTGTVADNLRVVVPDADDERLWCALRAVALEERVKDLPYGLATALSEDGVNLSAGERARLAIARVVLADRAWAFLDEPTAHLDDLTEQVIADTILELSRRGGVVVVAHRPEIVALADTVVAIPPPAEPAATTRRTTWVESAERPTAEASLDADPPARTGLTLSVLLGSLASAAGVALTASAGWLIVQAASRPAILTLLVAIVAVRTFGLARPALRYAERLRSHDVALRLLAARRVQVYDALVPLTPGRLGRRRGDLLASVVDDVDSVVDRQLRVRLPLWSFLVVAATAIGVTSLLSQPAAGVLALTALAGSAVFLLARAGSQRAERAATDRRAVLSAEVVETVQLAQELAMWQATGRAVGQVRRTSRRLGHAVVAGGLVLATTRALALLACGAAVAGTALLVAEQVRAGSLSGPTAALLVLVPLAMADLVVPLADAGALSARVRAAARRLEEIEHTQPYVTNRPLRELGASYGLHLLQVSAEWERGRPVLQDLDLTLPPGSRIAVVGESGSGKSTLAALMLRFLDPSRGRVALGGVRLDHLALDDVRRVVGLVDDDPHVFATTLAENVRLARPDALDCEVRDALERARLGPWLALLPDGLDTWLGDGHAGISGGERARLAVARALLAGQDVVVLDEPTAHLDHATAEALAAEVFSLRDRTVVWISHDRAGVELADRTLDLGPGTPSAAGARTA